MAQTAQQESRKELDGVLRAVLTFIFSRVNELTPDIAFGLGILFAGGAGVFAQQWLRDLY